MSRGTTLTGLTAVALVVALATGGVVVLSAFTSWWVLFALFGVLPPLMMAGCLAMVGAIRGRIGIGSCFAGPCARWFDAGVDRAAGLDRERARPARSRR